MRFLFIKLRHIGDSLLLTPTIVATKKKFPEAEIWVLVRRSCEGILAGCPEIDRLICTAEPEEDRRDARSRWGDFALACLLRRTDFDFVFELGDNDRGRWLALLARTKKRCANRHRSLHAMWRPFFHHITTKKRWPMHQVGRDYLCPADVLDLPETPPALRFDESRVEEWKPATALGNDEYAVIHFYTRWPSKSWPLDRWKELAARLLTVVPLLIVSCGPGREEVQAADELCAAVGDRAISTRGETNWAQLAGILQRAKFFVGVDTAAMHLAAAMQCPVVCLFGPSADFEFHPWSVPYWMIRAEDGADAETLAATAKEDLMGLISVEQVFEACTMANEKGGR